MAQDFGRTWWGRRWVEAIEKMDYSRLQRGKRYAKNGSVLAIEINKNKVKAKVQGSQRTPYSVKLEFEVLGDGIKKVIVEKISENPLILAKLLKGDFPQEIYQFMEKMKIDIFPNDWEMISPSCSCPDYAVPCKHLAAVMYLIGAEIDKNPFTIFTIQDFDVLKEIEKSGIAIESGNRTNIKKMSECYPMLEKKEENLNVKDKLREIDFSTIGDISHNIFQLLTESPDFYTEKNFKDVLNKFYGVMKKSMSVVVKSELNEEKKTHKLNDFIISYDIETGEHSYYLSKDGKYENVNEIEDIVKMAEGMPLGILVENAPKYAELILVKDFCITLMKNGAVVPELVKLDKDGFLIKWLPALIDENVRKCFEVLSEVLSEESFVINTKKAAEGSLKKGKVNYRLTDKHSQLLGLASVFIGNKITELSRSSKIKEIYDYSDSVRQIFFNTKPFIPKAFGEETMVHSINIWLSKLHLSAMALSPIIKAEEYDDDKIEVDIVYEIKRDGLIENVTIEKILNEKTFDKERLDAIKGLGFIADYFPEVEKLALSKGKDKIIKKIDDFAKVLFEILPLIRLMGLKVLLPKGMQEIINPKVSLSATKQSQSNSKYLDFDDMIQFDYKVALGNEFIDIDEFLKLVANRRGLIKIKDNYFYIDESFINKLKSYGEMAEITGNDRIKALIAEEFEGGAIEITDEVKAILNEFINGKSIEMPLSIKAELREYQKRGYEWLYKNARTGFGSLMADDMGLGKTLQVITLITKLKEEGSLEKKKAMVIVPTTLLTNWRKEIEKFSPDLKTAIYHGPTRKFEKEGYDVLVTSYGVIRSDIEILSKEKWALVAIDEAQNIKNPDTIQTKAVKKIKADIRIAMTGTPVENRLTEYWSIFDFTNKGYLGNLKTFKDETAIPIEVYRDKKVLDRFKKVTSPFIIRRVKSDKSIIKDLPDKIESDRFCALAKEQAALYKSVVEDLMEKIEDSEGIIRSGIVFKLMTSLKQICNHPSNFLKDGNTAINLSGKFESIMELLEDIYENNKKVLIFTQYKEMGDILVKEISNYYDTPMFLNGGTTRKERDEMVERFQNDPQEKIFILSLKAGGTGLNLTKASHVIHYDLWWNPAVEAQATDRAYRIGQTDNVNVHRLITQGTFEEKINEMIQKKKELANITVSDNEDWIGNFSNKELRELVKLER